MSTELHVCALLQAAVHSQLLPSAMSVITAPSTASDADIVVASRSVSFASESSSGGPSHSASASGVRGRCA